jgi:hypothetical protein
VQAVTRKLVELNEGFDGDVTPDIEGGTVTGLRIRGQQVTDISPVRELKGLRSLDCSDTKVSDLSPLNDMKLTKLKCNFTPVSDLSPLKDMQLLILDCSNTRTDGATQDLARGRVAVPPQTTVVVSVALFSMNRQPDGCGRHDPQ